MKIIWLRYGTQQTCFFCHFGPVSAFLLNSQPEKLKFWKTEKKPRDIILHLCSTNDNHMMHGSWDMECNKQIFLSFWAIFYLLNLLINRKIKIMKNEKTPEDIIILHLCTINYDHMMYGSWVMEHNRHIFLSFGTSFCPFTPLTTQKI